jgi:hypothetical protein
LSSVEERLSNGLSSDTSWTYQVLDLRFDRKERRAIWRCHGDDGSDLTPLSFSGLSNYSTVSCLEPVNCYKSQQIIAKKKSRAVVERLTEPMRSSNEGIARQHSVVV